MSEPLSASGTAAALGEATVFGLFFRLWGGGGGNTKQSAGTAECGIKHSHCTEALFYRRGESRYKPLMS